MRHRMCKYEALATVASSCRFRYVDTNAIFTLVTTVCQTFVEMPARCFAKCAPVSKD